MRKRIILWMLSMCLLLTGCGGYVSQNGQSAADTSDVREMQEYDAQNKYMLVNALSFQEGDGFFCGSGLTGNYIQYYDRVSGISGVLCGDPACAHDSTDCSSYIQAGATLFCCGEKRYWIAADNQSESPDCYLWRSDLTGINREKVKRLSYEDVLNPYQPQQYAIHKGRLFILGKADIVDGVNTRKRLSLLSSGLDSSEKFETLFDKTFEWGVQATIRFVGNSVYLSVISYPEGGLFDITVIKYSMSDGTSTIVYEESSIAEQLGAIWVTEQDEVYLPGAGEEYVYVWKLENGKRVEIDSWAASTPSVPTITDGIIIDIHLINGVRMAEIKNLSGDILYSGKLFPEDISGLEGNPDEYSYALVGGDADKIILNLHTFTEKGMVDYTIMLELNRNLKPTILWLSQR